jgi:hypothetical protein
MDELKSDEFYPNTSRWMSGDVRAHFERVVVPDFNMKMTVAITKMETSPLTPKGIAEVSLIEGALTMAKYVVDLLSED